MMSISTWVNEKLYDRQRKSPPPSKQNLHNPPTMASTDDTWELEAALSAACLSKDTTDAEDESPALVTTPLFEALMNSEWQHAFELCTPTTLATWVQSSGTAHTAHVIWKRLPIHEAARRQAPAWLLVKMLELYPESSCQKTQFGELPLHVAVETGSSPEVIHLLLVAYMGGVVVRDNSGRTPLQICKENEYPDPVVLESLERATKNHELLLEQHEKEMNTLKKNKEQEIQELCKKHVSDMRREEETQLHLQQAIQEAKQNVVEMSVMLLDSQNLADSKEKETDEWKNQVDKMQSEIEQLNEEKLTQAKELHLLQKQLEERDATIVSLKERIATLESDLQDCLVFSRLTVEKNMKEANEELSKVIASQQALQERLFGQVGNMELLLEKRSIDIPEMEQEEVPEHVPEVDTAAAIHAATKAATKALEVSNAKQGYV